MPGIGGLSLMCHTCTFKMERGMEEKEVEEGEGDGCSMCCIAYQHKQIDHAHHLFR